MQSDPRFGQQLQSIRSRISGGQSLAEIKKAWTQAEMPRTRWDAILFSLSQAFFSPETMMLEWMLRSNSRYSMAAESYNLAKNKNDYRAMMQAVAVMAQLDNNDIEMKRALGLISYTPQVMPENENEGQGYTDEDLRKTEERLVDELKKRVADKYEDRFHAQQPVTLAFLTGSDPGREADLVGTTPVDENPS